MDVSYQEFLRTKSHLENDFGFEPDFMPDFLLPLQSHLVEWGTRKGRAATFADTGLGKTLIQLVWAHNVVRKTNRPVLLLTPFAVAGQIIREAEKFGIPAVRTYTGEVHGPTIHVCNYERLHHYNREDFAGVSCDESSILKNFQGATKHAVTHFMKKLPYRMLATAT